MLKMGKDHWCPDCACTAVSGSLCFNQLGLWLPHQLWRWTYVGWSSFLALVEIVMTSQFGKYYYDLVYSVWFPTINQW